QPHKISTDASPSFLPPTVRLFASRTLGVPADAVPELWDVLKDDVWALRDTKLSATEDNLAHDLPFSMTLYPPTHHCTNPDCPAVGPLKKAEVRQVVIYSQGDGALPAHAVHVYCRGCNTNYHHGFSVQAGVRTYYGDTPKYLQIGEHQFAERKLVGLWVTGHPNVGRMENHDFAAGGWQFACTLTTEHVWDAFVLLTLLDHNDRKNTLLTVPHGGDQKNGFTAAMRARNREVVMEGQDGSRFEGCSQRVGAE
ncbi:hypothetical protein GGX14DRAFT_382954, partial [Mycena pura]